MSDPLRASSLRLRVPDPDRVASFYVDELGFREAPEGVRLDGFRLELEAGELEDLEEAFALGFTFQDRDARDEALERAREAALEVEAGTVDLPGGLQLHLEVGDLPAVRLTRLTIHREDPTLPQELAEVVLGREGNVLDARPHGDDPGGSETELGGLCIVAPDASIRVFRDPFHAAITFANPGDAVDPTPAGPRPGRSIDVV